jgi:hypothetical protein
VCTAVSPDVQLPHANTRDIPWCEHRTGGRASHRRGVQAHGAQLSGLARTCAHGRPARVQSQCSSTRLCKDGQGMQVTCRNVLSSRQARARSQLCISGLTVDGCLLADTPFHTPHTMQQGPCDLEFGLKVYHMHISRREVRHRAGMPGAQHHSQNLRFYRTGRSSSQKAMHTCQAGNVRPAGTHNGCASNGSLSTFMAVIHEAHLQGSCTRPPAQQAIMAL